MTASSSIEPLTAFVDLSKVATRCWLMQLPSMPQSLQALMAAGSNQSHSSRANSVLAAFYRVFQVFLVSPRPFLRWMF